MKDKPPKPKKTAAISMPAFPGNRNSYTQKLADEICDRIASGESVRTICQSDDMPNKSNVMRWLATNKENFRDQYARAKEIGVEAMAEAILDISDDGTNDTYIDESGKTRTDHDVIARSKLRVDTRKWIMSKLLPKKYGDKMAFGGADDLPAMQITAIEHYIIDSKETDIT